MAANRDAFFDDGETTTIESREDQSPPTPIARKRFSSDVRLSEKDEDPTVTPRSLSSPVLAAAPPSEIIKEEVQAHQSASPYSSSTDLSTDVEDKPTELKITPHRPTLDIDTQTDRLVVQDESIQTDIIIEHQSLTEIPSHQIRSLSVAKPFTTPLVKALLDQSISSALPIISFCQPFSMTSHANDVILAMPRHLMLITNQNSVSIYPWKQFNESTSTILECYWCSFLYKLLVTTLEDNRLFIYDLVSIIDSIQLRGRPLSVKHQNSRSKRTDSSFLLPTSSLHQPVPVIWSKTRFTKSNSLGIYYCFISERSCCAMLTRIDHNTRKHVKAIDCTGGSLNNRAGICALGLSDDRVAIVLTNLIMTLYNAASLVGLKQINLSRWGNYDIGGVSTLIYLWKTWVLFDPVENQIVGIGKHKRRFAKLLPEQPINACSMENGTLALWIGYPGAILYYRLFD